MTYMSPDFDPQHKYMYFKPLTGLQKHWIAQYYKNIRKQRVKLNDGTILWIPEIRKDGSCITCPMGCPECLTNALQHIRSWLQYPI
jgi:hypothetical protein